MAIDLYFNEKLHKYTDSRGIVYTSMTTVIGKYELKFDTEKMSKIVIKSKKSQYYGWTAKRVKEHWRQLNEKSLIKGNRVHNFLEAAVKKASGYELLDGKYINDLIYTVNNFDEILATNASAGELSLERLIEMDIDDKYPRIYKIIKYYNDKGFRIYSEIGIFDEVRMISGLIDILLINHDTKEFIVLDWKTNKHELVPFQDERYKWVSGYFKKDKNGLDTHNFVKTNAYFKAPINQYQQSHYLIYAFQLSGYTALIERLGYKSKGIILAHIREEEIYEEGDAAVLKTPTCLGKTKTDIYTMHYLKDDINNVFDNHFAFHTDKQTTLI